MLGWIGFFEPFTPSMLPVVVWEQRGGTWTSVGDDAMRGSAAPNGGMNFHVTPTFAPYSVETIFAFPSASSTNENYAGLVFGATEGETAFWACLYQNDARRISLWEYSGGSYINFVAQSDPVESNTTARGVVRRVRAYWDGATVTCTFENSEGGTGIVSATGPARGLDGRPGLRVYNETAEFRSFVVYEGI